MKYYTYRSREPRFTCVTCITRVTCVTWASICILSSQQKSSKSDEPFTSWVRRKFPAVQGRLHVGGSYSKTICPIWMIFLWSWHTYAVYLHTKNHRIPINCLGVTAVESLADLRSSSVMKNDGRRLNTASHLTIMIKTACEHILSVHWCKRLALELVPAKLAFCPTVQAALNSIWRIFSPGLSHGVMNEWWRQGRRDYCA